MRGKYLTLIVLTIAIVSAIVFYYPQSTAFSLKDEAVIISKKHIKDIEQIKLPPLKKVPVLMYHAISDVNSELCVSPADFRSQMEWLHSNNYSPITLKQLYEHWEYGKSIPSKPIVLTFDDGYKDNYTVAFKEMKKHNFVGVLFIYANKFTTSNSVSVDQLKEMHDYGWEIGNHSYYHKELTRVNGSSLIKETKGARDKLTELTGADITSFCYPAGKYDNKAVQAVLESGHVIAVTTNYGYSKVEQGILTLSRVRINRSDHLKGYIRKLT